MMPDLEKLKALLEKAIGLPWTAGGISLNDGSISIRSDELRIVIAQVTNAASFGDFVNAALAGKRTFGDGEDAHTQHAHAALIAEGISALPALVARVEELEGIRAAAQALADYCEKSTNVGPITKGPHREAKLWRELRAALNQGEAK